MAILWALVALLSIHFGGLSGVSGQILPDLLSSLPTSELPSSIPPIPPIPSIPSIPLIPSVPSATNLLSLAKTVPQLAVPSLSQNPFRPKKNNHKESAETNGKHCETSAFHFISKDTVDGYLNDTLKESIEKMFAKTKWEASGLLKTVLTTVDLGNVLGALPLNSGEGDDLLSGLPLLGSLTGALGPVTGGQGDNAGGLGSLTGALGPVTGLLSSVTGGLGRVKGVSSPPRGQGAKAGSRGSLNGVLGSVKGVLGSLPGGLGSLADGLGAQAGDFGSLAGGFGAQAGSLGTSISLPNLPDTSSLPGLGGSSGSDLTSNLGKGNKLLPVLSESGNSLEGKLASWIGKNSESQGLDKSEDVVNALKKAASSSANALSGALPVNLDLTLHTGNIDVKNITTRMENSYINVHALVYADINGPENLLGVAIDAVGFQAVVALDLKISLNTNDTQCVSFIIQDQNMQVKEVNMKLIKRVTETLPISLPLPVDSLIPTLLTVNMTDAEGDYNLVLKNPVCKNGTAHGKGDLFKYDVKKVDFTPKGILIAFCAEINYKDKSIPVLGGHSPQISTDGETCMSLSSGIVKTLVTHIAKESSVKTRDDELNVKSMNYKPAGKKGQLTVNSEVKENGFLSATIHSILTLIHKCEVKNGYLNDKFAVERSEHKINPAGNEVAETLAKLMTTNMVAKANADANRTNLPILIFKDFLEDVPVEFDGQGGLVACK